MNAQEDPQKQALPEIQASAALPKDAPGAAPESSGPPKAPQSSPGWTVTISDDKMSAFLTVKNGGGSPASLSPDEAKSLLNASGVLFGVLKDKDFALAIHAARESREPVLAAKGLEPKTGTPRTIQYLFDTDPLKVGTVKDGGDLDFRERGAIPHVAKGDIIARVVEGDKGVDGRDVHGEVIPPPVLDSITSMVRVGKGASKSEDGSSVKASMEGRPMVTADGRLHVLAGYVVQGDVGLETGHVHYDGAIDVKGVIQDGFEVTGGSLSAKELGRARVEVDGDVLITGGVLGARIKAGGSVRVKHIYGSTIEAVGDVVVEKQILDSRVVSGGACLIPRGKILSSGVCAKMGVEARQVGSDSSKACSILVGIDERLKMELERIKLEADGIRERIKKRNSLLEEIEKAQAKLQENIGQLAQVQDKAMVAARDLEKRIQKGEGDVSSMEMKAMAVKQQSAKVGRTLETLVEKQEHISGEKNKIREELKEREDKLAALKEEAEYLTALNKENPGKPVLKVQGDIFAGTILKGVHSSLTLPEDMSFVEVREAKILDDKDNLVWHMEVARRKP